MALSFLPIIKLSSGLNLVCQAAMSAPFIHENIWADKYKYEEAEKQYFERLAKGCSPANPPPLTSGASADNCSLASEVAKARQHIKTSLECVDRISTFTHSTGGADFVNRILSLEKENEGLRKLVEQMQKSQDAFEARLHQLEQKCSSVTSKPAATPAKLVSAPQAKPEEDETSKQVREKRLAEYAAKKSKKPTLIAKSNVILDVKPWDDETDMKKLEQAVRDIQMDGLLWGASKLVPLAYGIHKLQISCVVEDEKVSIDLLTESIEEKSDFVQSVDIAAFNKI
ncbi:hypothetical protein B566_EDAN016310 [Ephemera danica]|nr:hypothetical protein B566_EDAN016310 [Ephemera danica]